MAIFDPAWSKTVTKSTVSACVTDPVDVGDGNLLGLPADEGEPRSTVGPRAERLSRITAAIADAVSSEQVFEALVDHVADAVGASSVGLWLLDDDGDTAKMVRSLGYSDSAQKKFEVVSLKTTQTFPALESMRIGEALWFPSQQELVARYPHLRSTVTPGRCYRVSCLPLITHGRVLGTLGLTIEQRGEANDEERSFLLLVANYASQAIARLRLYEAERRSRAAAEQLYRFAQSVVDAERVEQVFEVALSAIEAALGVTRSAILTFDGEGVMRFRAWRNLSEGYRSAVDGHSPWAADAVAFEPVLIANAHDDPQMASYAPLFRSEGIGALAFIPLVASGRLLGKFMVYYEGTHVFADHEVEMAQAIGHHLASVVTRFAAVARLKETIRHNELFAGVLAHDLRNPLAAIMTAAQLMSMRIDGGQTDTESQEQAVTRILSSGRRMTRMIDQLLDFTRARSGGGIAVQPRESHLDDLVGQAMAELQLAHPHWRMHRTAKGNSTGRWDPDRLLQVVSNLVANAGQHGSAAGSILVEVDGTDETTVSFKVHNDGAISETILPTLFDPFRSTGHARDQSQGLGLGLFIVREVVRAHGGRVGVMSSPDEGTTFSIHLPRYPAP